MSLQHHFPQFDFSELSYFERLVFSEIASYKAINVTIQTPKNKIHFSSVQFAVLSPITLVIVLLLFLLNTNILKQVQVLLVKRTKPSSGILSFQ